MLRCGPASFGLGYIEFYTGIAEMPRDQLSPT